MLRSTRSRSGKALTLLAFALLMRSCVPFQTTTVHTIGYKLLSDDRSIDPETGNTILTSRWIYDDGVTTETTKILPKGTEERQFDKPPRPELRFAD